MFRRFPLAILGPVLLSGCAQSTLLFASGTTVGVKIGTTAQQVPVIQVGYDQLDAVILPLAMDRKRHTGTQNSICGYLYENPIPPDIKTGDLVKSCKFESIGSDKSRDSYSVYSNFSAKIGANTAMANKSANVDITLGKYFATGMAAERLAANAGNRSDRRSAVQVEIVSKLNSYASPAGQAAFPGKLNAVMIPMDGENFGEYSSLIKTNCRTYTNCITLVGSGDISTDALQSFDAKFEPFSDHESPPAQKSADAAAAK